MTQHQIDSEFRLMCASTLSDLPAVFASYGDGGEAERLRIRTIARRRPPLTELSARLKAAGL